MFVLTILGTYLIVFFRGTASVCKTKKEFNRPVNSVYISKQNLPLLVCLFHKIFIGKVVPYFLPKY